MPRAIKGPVSHLKYVRKSDKLSKRVWDVWFTFAGSISADKGVVKFGLFNLIPVAKIHALIRIADNPRAQRIYRNTLLALLPITILWFSLYVAGGILNTFAAMLATAGFFPAVFLSHLVLRKIDARNKKAAKAKRAEEQPLEKPLVKFVPPDIKHLTAAQVRVSATQLGVGGESTVVEGRYNNTKVAVKVPHSTLLQSTTLDNELQMLKQFNSPEIVNLIGYFDGANNKINLVFKFMSRGSLYDNIAKNFHITPKQEITILHDVAKAIHYLETRGFMHRDLKSQNVLLTNNYSARVTDFGMATPVDENVEEFRGTPIYTATEVLLRQSPGATPKSDVYSFAFIMSELGMGMRTEKMAQKITGEANLMVAQVAAVLGDVAEQLVEDRVAAKEALTPLSKGVSYTALQWLCWREDPKERIGTANLVEKLDELVSERVSPSVV